MTEETGQHEAGPQPLYVSLILDESGSMQSCKRAAIAGFNQYVKSLHAEPAPTWFTLTLFNSRRTEVRYQGVPVATVPELASKPTGRKTRRRFTMRLATRSPPPERKRRSAARSCASFSLTAWRTHRRSSHGSRFTRLSRTASRKAGGLSIWVPITTCGRRAKTWAWHKNAGLPFQRATSGRRSTSCPA